MRPLGTEINNYMKILHYPKCISGITATAFNVQGPCCAPAELEEPI